ncbi:MAG: hypothetical protein IJ205_09225 [Bacteroidales bacterium]|nr:hypothetical protein [Bacteroidales bacterium]
MNRFARLKKWNEYRSWPAGFYHMIIDSFEKGQLFHNDAQFAAGMNTVALGQYIHRIKILIFELMSNHAHFMIWATGSDAVDFFVYQKKRINARLIKDGFPPLPDDLGFMLVPVDTSDPYQLQNGIIYIARNPHKADPAITPSGYLWGSSYLLFSRISTIIQKKQVKDYSVDFMRNVLCSKTRLPDNYVFNENLGIILPESYVLNQKTEKILKSAWNYCGNLVKNMDAYVKISERIGAKISINDRELDTIIYTICKNKYNVKSYLELSLDDRCRLGVRLYKEYHIDVKRICRKIGIEYSIMAELIK